MQISVGDVESFLTQHFQAAIQDVMPVTGGQWSQTFFFTRNQQHKVIRFGAYADDYYKDRFAARFCGPNLPIPPVEEIGSGLGLCFAIAPRVMGEMIDDLPAPAMRQVLPALVDLWLALYDVDAGQTHGSGGFGADGQGGSPSWQAYLRQQPDDAPGSRLQGWRASLASHPAEHALYLRGQRHLLGLMVLCPEERHLVHNDLLHHNLLVHGGRVAGVIDWGCALWGDFLYDLAMFTTWQFYYPAMHSIDFASAAAAGFGVRGIALPNFEARLVCYQLHLLLDSLIYNAWRADSANLALTSQRIELLLADLE